MMAVVRVDAELVDHLEGVLAPVLDVDERVVQRRAVITGETVALAQGSSRRENIWRDDLVQAAAETRHR
jgi:hypothetical protein